MTTNPLAKRQKLEQALVKLPQPKKSFRFPGQLDLVVNSLSFLGEEDQNSAWKVCRLFREALSKRACYMTILKERLAIATPELSKRRRQSPRLSKALFKSFLNPFAIGLTGFIAPHVIGQNLARAFYLEVAKPGSNIDKGLRQLKKLTQEQRNSINQLNLARLQESSDIQDKHVQKLFKLCPKIKDFKFLVTPIVTGSFLDTLPEDFEGFEAIDFDYEDDRYFIPGGNPFDGMEATFCNHLQRYFETHGSSNVKTLNLTFFNEDIFWHTFNRNWKSLEEFRIHFSIEDDKLGAILKQAPNLKHLEIDGKDLEGSCLVHANNLESLDIFNASDLNLEFLKQCLYQNAPTLQKLYLDCELGSDFFENLPLFPRLQTVEIPDLENPKAFVKSLSNKALKSILRSFPLMPVPLKKMIQQEHSVKQFLN